MSKLTVADIIALHDAGLSDDLIDKLNTDDNPVSKTDPAKKDPNKVEQSDGPKSASEILSSLFEEDEPANKD